MSSNVTILHIPVTHLIKLWMEKIGMVGSWSKSSGLVSKHITNLEKIIMQKSMINNLVLSSERGIAVCWKIFITESRVTEKRHDKVE